MKLVQDEIDRKKNYIDILVGHLKDGDDYRRKQLDIESLLRLLADLHVSKIIKQHSSEVTDLNELKPVFEVFQRLAQRKSLQDPWYAEVSEAWKRVLNV